VTILTRAEEAVKNLEVNDMTDKGRSLPGRMQASRPLQKRLQGPRRWVMCSHAQYLRADRNQFDGDSLDMMSFECTFGGPRPGRNLDVRRWRHGFCKKTAKAAPLGHPMQSGSSPVVSPTAPS